MSRKNALARIHELDLDACQFAFGLISKGVDFSTALQSAERYHKEEAKA